MPWRPPADERPERDERVERCFDRLAELTRTDGRLQRTLDALHEGAFLLGGQRWSVRWLDEQASERFRREQGFEDYVR